MSKSLRRAQRKAAKEAARNVKSVRLREKVDVPRGPVIAGLSNEVKATPTVGAHLHALEVPQQPKIAPEDGHFQLLVTWCARLQDVEGAWSWDEPRQWSAREWDEDILPGLNHLEGADWRAIDQMNTGSGHKLHHYQEVDSFCKDAQNRWSHLGYEQFDTAFRFRFGNKKRAWGIEHKGHFFMIWWERNHLISPTADT